MREQSWSKHEEIVESAGQNMSRKRKMSNSDQQTSTSNPLIWFHLYDYGTGIPHKGTSATKVSVPLGSDIADFRDAVKVKCHNKLSAIDANDLIVFKNKDSFGKRDSKEEKVIYNSLTIRKSR